MGITRRVTCISLLAAGIRPARAQGRMRHVGFVSGQPAGEAAATLEHIREGLRSLGWEEGRTLTIDAAYGDRAAIDRALAAFVSRPVDVIVARATGTAHRAKEATRTIPIVVLVSDALSTGLVGSLSRPEGNVTGMSLQGPDLSRKRLEILRETIPGLRRLAFLGDAADPNAGTFVRETTAAAGELGLTLVVRLLDSGDRLAAPLFAGLSADGVQAVIVQPIWTGYRDRIVQLADAAGIPVVADYKPFAEAGALFTFGADDAVLSRRLGVYVDRLLRGARPGDLPVEQPSAFTLVVNLQAARRFGITVPLAVLSRAGDVIE